MTLGAVLLLSMLWACSGVGVGDAERQRVTRIEPGRGAFTFDGYAPLSDRPVRVYYDAPEDPASAEVLIVMHGLGRDGEAYRADWEPLVQGRNVLVLVPEFSDELYPASSSYNVGNVVDTDGDPLPQELWSFNVVEALFDHVVRDVGSKEDDYALFGHSAGAQFVHRFVEFMPEHRARVAVAANAGWYTMPDDSKPFPYGLDDAPVQQADLGPAFASNLVVLLGADDIDPDDRSLRRNSQTDEQGRHRLERGFSFYRIARKTAEEESLPFRWRLQVVPGVAHTHRAAAAAAAPLVLGGP